MKQMKHWTGAVAALALFVGCAGDGITEPGEEGEAAAPILVGDVRPVSVQTPVGYLAAQSGSIWRQTIQSPGAEFVRVHLTGLDLAPGDTLTVSSLDGSQVWTYEDRGPHGDGDVWTFAVNGDSAVVELHSAGSGVQAGGFRIESIGHGAKSLGGPEVVCSIDGREDVACHPEADAQSRPVARLLFTSGGSQYLCTGWLASGSNANTLVTNNHCFSSQTEVNTLQAMFNFQKTTCGGNQNAATTSYAGGTFLRTNTVNKRGKKGGLDYTLATLQGNPEATWGELTPTTHRPAVGDDIWFIQHPGGNEKEIGYYEDTVGGSTCHVNLVNQTYSGTAQNSQTAYACDSEGGSSGSPVVDPGTGHVIALHHFGGVSNSPCLNSGSRMDLICADAGGLLTCASN